MLIGFGGMFAGIASCIYGIFGMNFILPEYPDPTTIVPDAHAFNEVTILTSCLCVVLWLALVYYAKRQRLLHYVFRTNFGS